MTLAVGTPIGKYVVKHKLAEGGMAEIYLATAQGAEGFEKEVVIKRVRSFLADDEGFVRMFIAEARLVSRLNHANVVQIFDFDKHEDSYYLAMEYVRGCSLWELRKRCRDKGVSMPPVLVAHLGAQVAAGLHYAHRIRSPDGEPLHLVHRDVTPQNVLLSLDGAVKLTDFGIAKAGGTLTQPGVLKGKFAYMAPEQARGEPVDARTDVFALGVVLWEMLTGGRLFEGDSELAVLRAVQESVIVPPARLNPDVPESLDTVVCTALQREPAARYQTAGELERALAQCVLRCATSVDDTDVGTFVRRVLDAPLTQVIPLPSVLRDPSLPAESPAPPREPTAVMPGSTPSLARSRPQALSVRDSTGSLESASTLVLDRARPPSTGRLPESLPLPTPVAAPPPIAPPATSAEVLAPAPVASRSRGRLGMGVGAAGLVVFGVVLARLGTSGSPPPASPPPVVQVAPSPMPPPAPVEPAPPAPAPEPIAVKEAPTPAVKVKGTLIVQAIPYADVYLDDKLLRGEVTGVARFQVEPGTHTLTLKHPARIDTSQVTIPANGQVRHSFSAVKR